MGTISYYREKPSKYQNPTARVYIISILAACVLPYMKMGLSTYHDRYDQFFIADVVGLLILTTLIAFFLHFLPKATEAIDGIPLCLRRLRWGRFSKKTWRRNHLIISRVIGIALNLGVIIWAIIYGIA